MNNTKPILTIGMIVKDEIRIIERCLQALQPLRDAVSSELIIADTGSRDGTREVCEKYADVLFDFQWIKDFAAARNSVLDKAKGQWYLSVDADEILDDNISEIVRFIKDKKSVKYEAVTVVQRNYKKLNSEKDTYSDFYAHRLYLNKPGLR